MKVTWHRRLERIAAAMPGEQETTMLIVLYRVDPDNAAAADQAIDRARSEMPPNWHGTICCLPEVEPDPTEWSVR